MACVGLGLAIAVNSASNDWNRDTYKDEDQQVFVSPLFNYSGTLVK